ncbi:MAG: hypothetical protein OXN85_11510 [Gemmatimonadetes bacterium]|nr:hypothetical protein [Candidatus Palauibacter australiensis]
MKLRRLRMRDLALGILLLSGIAIGSLGLIPTPRVDLRWEARRDSEEEYRPGLRLREGRELLLVAILSSRCYWSNVPETIEGVKAAKLLVARQAEERGVGFAAMGVARDMVAAAGIVHLERHGPFDEVVAGRSWISSGVLQFIYNDELPGWAGTPQIVVVEQIVTFEAGSRRIEGRRELVRKLGPNEIAEWVAAGAPVEPVRDYRDSVGSAFNPPSYGMPVRSSLQG